MLPRELVFEYGRDLFAQSGDIVPRGVPQDLPIQIEVRVHNPLPDGHKPLPRRFRVTFPEFRREVADGFANHAARMSLRSDASCRIDNPGFFEDMRTYPRL